MIAFFSSPRLVANAALLAVLCVAAGCTDLLDPGPKKKAAATGHAVAGPAGEDDDEVKDPRERAYSQLADQFAQALVRGDYQAAHALGSSHLQARMTVEQLAAAEQKSFAEYGKPLKAERGGSVNSDVADLGDPNRKVAGETPVDAGLRRVSTHRAVGDIPASVPIQLRKASVAVTVIRARFPTSRRNRE